jgi:uncharacterized damage-inducible protein DinB
MMQKMYWFERKFKFDLAVWMYPNIVERLRGTPARLEERIGPLSARVLTHRDGDAWSIQENIGHLHAVEALWLARLNNFDAGEKHLDPADLENRRTYEADYNAQPIGEVLGSFREAREEFVERLDRYDEAFVLRSAMHPRLETPMRVIDLAFFTAEHDDHHLARITELIRKFSP